MKSFLISTSLLLSIFCFTQERECLYPESDDFTGTCEANYTNGNIKFRTDFKDGLRHGEHKEYYKTGQLAASASYNHDRYLGKAYRYSESGIVLLEMEFDTDETGWFIYYDADGKNILATGQFENSYRDGEWKFYNKLGEITKTEIHKSKKTRKEIYGNKRSKVLFIPHEETIDKVFLEDYAMPIELTPETIVDSPDIPAEFPNGSDQMSLFLSNIIHYPTSAIKNKQEGKVYLSFIVELDGSLTSIKVVRGVCKELDQEAKQAVEKMPNWTPAIYRNQKVRSVCYLPISFNL